MFDQQDVRVHQLAHSIRGPEWAFALPQGDLEALEDVMQACSGFWNGVGSLLVPVRSDGRLYPHLERMLEIRQVERVYVHRRLGTKAVEAVARRLPDAGQMYDGFSDHELPPLYLSAEDRSGPAPTLWRPRPRTNRLRRIALATWGHIPDGDLPEWRRHYEVAESFGDHACQTLLSSQILANTPLLFSARYMPVFEQQGLGGRPALFVLGDASFNELVRFWNFRSRATTWRSGLPIVGVPRELLSAEELQPVLAWVESIGGGMMRFRPDLSLIATEKDLPQARDAIEALGFSRPPTRRQRPRGRARPAPESEELQYVVNLVDLAGSMRRGATTSSLVTVTNRNIALDLPPPNGIRLPYGQVRLCIRGLPLALPLNAVTAETLIPNATVSQDGLTMATMSSPRWRWDIQLPDQREELEQWSRSLGFSVSSSQPGLYAEALLGRLPGAESLNALATEAAVSILDALAPKSSKKLAQRIAAEAERRWGPQSIDEERIVELLRDEELPLDIDPSTLGGIASGIERAQGHLIGHIAELVQAGLVRRGVRFRCWRCNFQQLRALNELDERAECRACRAEIVIPVVEGTREHPISYFLDGLAARIMDQDLLPVILALRRSHLDRGEGHPFFAWPGLLFRRDDDEIDADLLTSNGDAVTVIECKRVASALTMSQAEKLIALCRDLDARPGIAALEGDFDPDVVNRVHEERGLVYTRRDLLSTE